jgi:hypothetical protein
MDAIQGMKEALRQGWIVCLSLFFFMTLSVSASQNITIENGRVYALGDTLKLDVKFDSLFSQRALNAIESGMTTSIVLELRIETEPKSRLPVQTLRIRLDHDIWEGQYRVVRQASVPETLQTADFKTAESFCSDLKNITLGSLPPGKEQVVLQARIGVNPISPEQQQRTRKWLNLLEKGSLLEFFIPLGRPSERTRWIEVDRFSPEDLK